MGGSSKRLGLTKRRVLELVGLLDLSDEIKEDIRQKKLTERHGKAPRKLLDKAEVLRDVFSFIKNKKLTGEQTQELVQSIKSEPQFTIEESYNHCSIEKTKRDTVANDPLGVVVNASEKLTKAIKKLDISHIEKIKNNNLKAKLLVLKT